MGEELGLARLAEEPILILPPLACDLSLTVGAVGCQFHSETPFTVIPYESHPPTSIAIANPLPEHVITEISRCYVKIGDDALSLVGKNLPFF